MSLKSIATIRVRPRQTQVQPGPYNGQTRRDFGSCDYGIVYGDESGEDTLWLSYFFAVYMAETSDQPARACHMRVQLAISTENK